MAWTYNRRLSLTPRPMTFRFGDDLVSLDANQRLISDVTDALRAKLEKSNLWSHSPDKEPTVPKKQKRTRRRTAKSTD